MGAHLTVQGGGCFDESVLDIIRSASLVSHLGDVERLLKRGDDPIASRLMLRDLYSD